MAAALGLDNVPPQRLAQWYVDIVGSVSAISAGLEPTPAGAAASRQLRAGGFMEPIVFVSKNKRDYWEPGTTQIHHDLLPEISNPAVQITFSASLAAALGSLGI